MRYRANKKKCHADADADANADPHQKQYVPLPFGGGHNEEGGNPGDDKKMKSAGKV